MDTKNREEEVFALMWQQVDFVWNPSRVSQQLGISRKAASKYLCSLERKGFIFRARWMGHGAFKVYRLWSIKAVKIK
jgi:biotin operon repressor